MKRLLLCTLGLSTTIALAALSGCNLGGLNDNVHNPGDEDGGVKIASGDIAVAPSGDFFLFERDGQLAVGWVATGAVDDLPVSKPVRLAFSKQRRIAYVTSESGTLYAVDIDGRNNAWSAITEASTDPMVVSSQDDERVAVGSGRSIQLFDAEDGALIVTHDLDREIIDIEVLPDDERLIAVEDHQWIGELPSTTLVVMDLEVGATSELEVPNCADNIIVPKSGEMALLAPTRCQQDPISYIDLTAGQEQFVRNLPGFGPVALGPDGVSAVGFLDMQAVDETLFDDPEDIPPATTRYHLMVIDTEDMSYDFYAWGERLPRYAMTPDGSVLLVDEFITEGSARLFDIEDRDFETISGPGVTFEQLTFSGDSQHAFILSDPVVHGTLPDTEVWTDYQLFDLTIPSASVKALPTDFRPRNVNISPDAGTLFLRQDDSHICLYSLQTESCELTITLTST